MVWVWHFQIGSGVDGVNIVAPGLVGCMQQRRLFPFDKLQNPIDRLMRLSMSQRKFGIEIEHISNMSHGDFATRLINDNVPVDTYATGLARCPNDCYSGWQVKTDGSITTEGDYDYGIELVSPPMTFIDLPHLRSVLSLAREHGGVNSSCGLHVHVHAPELHDLGEHLPRLTKSWQNIEQVIFSYMPLSRRTNTYCKPGLNQYDRYQALNLDPLMHSRRTIEFRAHSATLNYHKIISWVNLCVSFVEYMVHNQELPMIDAKLKQSVPPKMIRPKNGTQFSLYRPQPLWVVESKKVNLEFPDLREGFKELQKPLGLAGADYLEAFRFPFHGNAMTQLCKVLKVNGVFRAYIEDRYERITNKNGFADPGNMTQYQRDEEDFYTEETLIEP